jgi:two-component system response regulator DesR
MIRVLCVDDDPLVRTYLATRLGLEGDIDVKGLVPSAGEALTFLCRQPVDVVLLEYQLEGADGMQLLVALARSSPAMGASPPRVLFCTGAADAAFVAEARALGAAGVISKDKMASELLPAVRAVASGEVWFEGGASRPLA